MGEAVIDNPRQKPSYGISVTPTTRVRPAIFCLLALVLLDRVYVI